ncbi:MAG: hypothetical protein CM1200mP26_15180 [Acidimicrobiales bacterium]|nr:MAG: hypothetical protein CM1200mP26_15180 [Acidimicrobiales bacterium]
MDEAARLLRGENIPMGRPGEPDDMAGPALFLPRTTPATSPATSSRWTVECCPAGVGHRGHHAAQRLPDLEQVLEGD